MAEAGQGTHVSTPTMFHFRKYSVSAQWAEATSRQHEIFPQTKTSAVATR